MSDELRAFARETAPDELTVARIRRSVRAPSPTRRPTGLLALVASGAAAVALLAMLAVGASPAPAPPAPSTAVEAAYARVGTDRPAALHYVRHHPVTLSLAGGPR